MIEPVNLPSAAGIDYGSGDVRHFAQGDAVDVPGLSNPTRELAERDNILATKVNEVVQSVNNREQFIPLPVIRTVVAPGDEIIVTNYRIPAGFEARVLNAAISSTPSSAKALLNLYYNETYGATTGTLIVTATSAAEFTGETSFHQAGEIIVTLKNTGTSTLEVSASVMLTMRPLGSGGVLLVGSIITGPQGQPGPKGDPGPQGPPGIGSDGSAGMIWRGAWNNTTAYVVNDVVSDTDASGIVSSYICTVNNTGMQPYLTPAKWDLVAKGGAKGATGDPGANGTPGTPGSSVVPNYGSHIVYGTFAAGVDWAYDPLDGFDSIKLNAGEVNKTIPLSEVFIASASANPGYSSSVNILAGVLRLSFKGAGTFTLPSTTNGGSYAARVNYTNASTMMIGALNGTTPYSTLDGSIKGVTTLPVNSNQFVVKSLNNQFAAAELTITGIQVS